MKTKFRSIPIGIPNKNGRIYNLDMMTKVIEDYNANDKKLPGQLNHPENADEINLRYATHSIKNVSIKNIKVPRKLKKKMKKNGTFDKCKQLYVEIKLYPAGKQLKELLHNLVLSPSSEGIENPDGSADITRLITFNFIKKSEATFRKYL